MEQIKTIVKLLFYSILLIFLVMLYFKKCSITKPTIIKETTYITDTIYKDTIQYRILIDSAKPRTKIIIQYELPQWAKDSLAKHSSLYAKIDTVLIDSSKVFVRDYQDSVINNKYRIIYNASVLGHLLSMNTQVDIYTDSIVASKTIIKTIRPKINLGIGISNIGNVKLSAGYKGWFLEGSSDFKKLNEIYITKQFIINEIK